MPAGIEPGAERDRLEEGLEELLATSFPDRPLAAASLVGSPPRGLARLVLRTGENRHRGA